MEEFYKIYESINVLKFFMPGILLILIPNYILLKMKFTYMMKNIKNI